MSKNNSKPPRPPGLKRTVSAGLPRPKSSAAEFVKTELIDEPTTAARATFDEDKLNELITSIGTVGLLEPLIVKPTGKRYRVLAGHRRLIACRALGFKEILCIIWTSDTLPGEAVTSHENAFREDLNAAEEAHYFGELMRTLCGNDVDRLCKQVQQSRAYVEARLILLAGCQKTLEALARQEISIGVAQELNRIPEYARRMVYLDAAIKGGATTRLVKQWRINDVALAGCRAEDIVNSQPEGVAIQKPYETTLICCVCHSAEEPYNMEILYVHRFCRKATLDRVMRYLEGGDTVAPENG